MPHPLQILTTHAPPHAPATKAGHQQPIDMAGTHTRVRSGSEGKIGRVARLYVHQFDVNPETQEISRAADATSHRAERRLNPSATMGA
jgi:hypothetical protein